MEIIQPPCGTNHYLQPEEEATARGGGCVPGPCRGGGRRQGGGRRGADRQQLAVELETASSVAGAL
jgi:hypothetical protein